MDIDEARAVAEFYIAENMHPALQDSYIIVDDGVIVTRVGWYFPYQSRAYMETGNIDFALVGNWPIFVGIDGSCSGGAIPDLRVK
ncbi:YrhB domain-containing protein [Achromobacter spanius]|uniref:YrhB domain-containing protein n=1 Tax=Achromobacter spanius TaxID=217203 RepID=UPI003208297D